MIDSREELFHIYMYCVLYCFVFYPGYDYIIIWIHGKCIDDNPFATTTESTALDCQTYCETIFCDAFTFYVNLTCHVFRIRGHGSVQLADNSNCISGRVTDPKRISFKKQSIFVGYVYNKIRAMDSKSCALTCNYDLGSQIK